LPDDILVKVDRAAMSLSLETRAPFLDKDLMEFAWTLPLKLKINKGNKKWILKELLHNYVPKGLVDRPKMGFAIPLDKWLRGPLRDWAENQISKTRLIQEGYLDQKQIRSAWTSHLASKSSSANRLWSILMFQAWLEHQAEYE